MCRVILLRLHKASAFIYKSSFAWKLSCPGRSHNAGSLFSQKRAARAVLVFDPIVSQSGLLHCVTDTDLQTAGHKMAAYSVFLFVCLFLFVLFVLICFNCFVFFFGRLKFFFFFFFADFQTSNFNKQDEKSEPKK